MNKKWIVAFLMVVHLGITAYVGLVILGGIPHIPDSAMYYRQAILLSHGKLYISDFAMHPQDAFMLMGNYERDGKVFFHYPHFWPVLIAIFIKLNIPWLLNPLLSALSLLLIFLIARKMFDENTGVVASALYCFSPFVILMAGDYMMHAATLFFLLAAFYFVLVYIASPTIWSALLAGLSLGYAFNLRPLTVIGVFAPIGIYLLISYRKRVFKWKSAWFVLGFACMFALLLGDNYIMTGAPFKIEHPIGSFINDPQSIFSFSNVQSGANHADTSLPYFSPLIFHSFIPDIILALSVIPLIVSRRRNDFLLMGIFIMLVALYMLTYAEGIHGYGPRYYYEASFAVLILAARGILWIIDQFSSRRKQVVAGFFVFLLMYDVVGLVVVLPQYKDYNFIPTKSFEQLKALDLKNSIVIIGRTWNWFEDGVTATLYDPEYKDAFFIKELENGDHLKVLQQYPEKKVYKIVNVKKDIKYLGVASNLTKS